MGSGGWIPTSARETCSYIVNNNGDILFLDMGTGISRFDLFEHEITGERVNIVLSHYHLDHIIGFVYFLNVCRDKEIYIWGPGKDFYGATCKEILEKIISPPYFGRPIMNFSNNVVISDFRIGVNNITDNLIFETVMQKHSSPSFGIIVNNKVYYATDTSVLNDTFKKSVNFDCLLHECWTLDNEMSGSKHSSLVDIIKMFDEYRIENLKLIHINPNWREIEFEKAAKMIGKRNISFANDGDIYFLDKCSYKSGNLENL